MKRLAIIPGYSCVIPCIEIAHRLGIYVITADNKPSNPAHALSDEYVNVNMLDCEALYEALKDKNIDGIMTYGYDPGAVPAAYVAEKLGLPSPGPFESVCILQNKGKFRKFLKENGFNAPNSFSFESKEKALEKKDAFSYPVIVKPTDSAGSKGVTKVDRPDELDPAIDTAIHASFEKCFVIEDYLDLVGLQSDCEAFSDNGKLVFSAFSSQRSDKKSAYPFVPALNIWPSTMDEAHKNEVNSEIQRLLRLLNMKTATYNIEARVCKNGKLYIMECSPRSGGNKLAICYDTIYNTNLVENTVRAAVGMEIVFNKEQDKHRYYYEEIVHTNVSGIFKGIEISDQLKGRILFSDIFYNVGDEISEFSSATGAMGLILFEFDSLEAREDAINHSDAYIKVLTEPKENNNGD